MTPTLVRSISVFSVMLIFSLIFVSTSYIYKSDSFKEQQASERAMRLWQIKINSSVESNQIIDEFEANFLKLVNQGVVGEENRLSWFETIQSTAKKRGMPSVKYSISERKPLSASSLGAQYQGIDVFKSVMTLNIKMAHEGDLFALLNDLRKADGLFTIDSCNIEKISKKSVDTENNMKAYCKLGWYTFKGSKSNTAPKT